MQHNKGFVPGQGAQLRVTFFSQHIRQDLSKADGSTGKLQFGISQARVSTSFSERFHIPL